MPHSTERDMASAGFAAAPVSQPAQVPRRRLLRWFILGILVAAAIGSGGAWWFTGRAVQQAKAPPPLKVPVMTVVARTVPIYRTFPATTQAMRTVTILARVTGYLAERDAADGSDVTSGALLYRIDAKDYQTALAQAQALRSQAGASLDYSRVTQARNKNLADKGWATKDALDQANSTYDQGQANVASNDAALEQASLNLSRTEIRAPFAGRLSASQVFEGSLISIAGATLNTLVQLDPIYVSFNPAEVNLDAITREQAHGPIETVVSVPGVGSTQTGPLTFIDNQVSLSTGTILLRATISNPDHALLPGQYVTARLHLGDLKDALLIPQSAVGSTQIGRTVMVVGADNEAEQRGVTLGDVYDDTIVITKGLKAGDRIITGQLQKLKPGTPIEAAEGR
jgi:multidrug efflux system membrane fusion protein